MFYLLLIYYTWFLVFSLSLSLSIYIYIQIYIHTYFVGIMIQHFYCFKEYVVGPVHQSYGLCDVASVRSRLRNDRLFVCPSVCSAVRSSIRWTLRPTRRPTDLMIGRVKRTLYSTRSASMSTNPLLHLWNNSISPSSPTLD